MAGKPLHNKREFDKICKALEKDRNLTYHYDRQDDRIDFIYMNKLTGKKDSLRYERK